MRKLYRYSGAGNLFVIADGRNGGCVDLHSPAVISEICKEYGTDGLMILQESEVPGTAFRMVFYNPDGSGGMMCGNGGRCIAAFAARVGAAPAHGEFSFVAADGLHSAELLSREGETCTVRLGMIDVHRLEHHEKLGLADPDKGLGIDTEGYFLETGTRHYVRFVSDIKTVDIGVEGLAIRRCPEFMPVGTNANFAEPRSEGLLAVRTFEKGVEGETGACGTGITACAIAAYAHGIAPASERRNEDGTVDAKYDIRAVGGMLSVDFTAAADRQNYSKVHLTGPAEFQGELELRISDK